MYDLSVIGTPFRMGGRGFEHGLGTHSVSHLRVISATPITGLSAWVGVDSNTNNAGVNGSVTFRVVAGDRTLFESGVLTPQTSPERLELETPPVTALDLMVGDGGDGAAYDHANWAEAVVRLEDGSRHRLSDLPSSVHSTHARRPYPFHFLYEGRSSDECLPEWEYERRLAPAPGPDSALVVETWQAPDGLLVTCESRFYQDTPAVDWILRFANTARRDTGLVAEVQTADLSLGGPVRNAAFWDLNTIRGGQPNPRHFEPERYRLPGKHRVRIGSDSGRSSNRHCPFFDLRTGLGSFVLGLEWSGTWQAVADTTESGLELRVGMAATHFRLHPGEEVRGPRVLLLHWTGDPEERHGCFRRLVYNHYSARGQGAAPLPVAFCNTCFTRGGGWLNETTAENQISLIRAYAELGAEAVITDAGWFVGGWPDGAGNYTPRADNYPDGMAPVAAAAREAGIRYGLWFEPERVVHDTDFHRLHPDWVLQAPGNTHTYLADFGLPEVREHFLEIVRGFMELPGFAVYRQDFNMDPLPYWQANDAPDRVGITEIRYVQGLYTYWETIRAEHPDCLMEECASGGHRIDLGTVMRMDIHQKTDYWFDHETDQTSLWGISQYLPNHTIVAHLVALDDYSFYSTLPSSLCLGWIADAPGFDRDRAQDLLERYRAVRHLLVGDWYPLLPCPHPWDDFQGWLWTPAEHAAHRLPYLHWTGSQFHRADLQEGVLLVFRRPDSPYREAQVRVRGLDRDADYELHWDGSDRRQTVSAAELEAGLVIELPSPRSAAMIHYRRLPRPQ
jgi:alpha-galactosidase